MLLIKIVVSCCIEELLFYVICGVSRRLGKLWLVISGLFIFVGLVLNIFILVLVIWCFFSVFISVCLFIKLLCLVLISRVLGFICVNFVFEIIFCVLLVSG